MKKLNGLMVTTFTFYLGYFGAVALIPVYLVNLGYPAASGSLAMGVGSILALIMRPYAGGWGDHRGHLGPIAAGTGIFVASALMTPFAHTFLAVLFIRLMMGVALGFYLTCGTALAVQAVAATEKGRAIVAFWIANGAGGAIGPVLIFWAMAASGNSFAVGFDLCAACGALSLLSAMWLPRSESATHRRPWGYDRETVGPALVHASFWVTQACIISFGALWIKHVGGINPGIALGAEAAGMTVARAIVSPFSRQVGAGKLVIPCAPVLAALLVALAWAQSGTDIGLICVGIGLCFGASQVDLATFVVTRSDESHYGFMMATFNAGQDVALIVGAFVLTALVAFNGIGTAFLAAALAVGAGGIGFIPIWLRHNAKLACAEPPVGRSET